MSWCRDRYSKEVKFAHLSTDGDTGPRLAVVSDDAALFLDQVMDAAPRDLQDLLDSGHERQQQVRGAVRSAGDAPRTPLSEVRYASAVLRPAHVIAIGLNYAAHSSELKLRADTAPTVFSLWPNSLAGHQGTTFWPEPITKQVDYEAELGVIIGTPARNVHVRDALDHVFGYTAVNDITARDLQFSEAQWSRCKSFDGFTPTGPVVVTADEIPDPQNLWLTTNLDGHLLQDASTADMVRTVAELIAYLSQSITLLPGTLISTGSPGGAGYSRDPQVFLRDYSTVTVTIEKIGSLTTHCRIL